MYWVFLVILRVSIEEINLSMSCEGDELVLTNWSKRLGNREFKIILESFRLKVN